MGISTQYQRADEDGAKTQNTEWLAADLIPAVDDGKATIYRVTMAFLVTAPIVEVTYDSGTTWHQLNSGAAIPINRLFSFDLSGLNNGDLVNFRTPTSGGTTLNIFRVDSLPVGD